MREKELFAAFAPLRIGVIGDFALDVYFGLATQTGEVSVETGKAVHHGSHIRAAPGGAGNVALNLAALGVGEVQVFGLVGNDLFGRELRHLFHQQHIQTQGLLTAQHPWESCAYLKPMLGKTEHNRLDFGSHNHAAAPDLEAVFEALSHSLPQLHALIINQQFAHPLLRQEVVKKLDRLLQAFPHCRLFADMRSLRPDFRGATLKLNAAELAGLLALDFLDEQDDAQCEQSLKQARRLTSLPILLTRGSSGLMYAGPSGSWVQPGIYLRGPIDSVGAGDACISAFAACMAAGMPVKQALEVANLAAAVTTRKLYQTGTASPAEIVALAQDCGYNYHLDLAADLRKAHYLPQSEIEVVEPIPTPAHFTHAIFDHDGTLSTLREGWEAVMLEVMMEMIAGAQLHKLDTATYEALKQACARFINDTTGVQTIVQMQGLREMAQAEGYIPEEQLKTPAEYKALYLQRLMGRVEARLRRLRAGERDLRDFSIRGAADFVYELKNRGLQLYLASGTDEQDVVAEAEALGYAAAFEGGIFGSKGNEVGDAKQQLIQRLLQGHIQQGSQLLVIGDGPVEIMEGRRAGACCIGIASDELRRYGLNPAKRSRLIRAGAHIILPDFSQAKRLLDWLVG